MGKKAVFHQERMGAAFCVSRHHGLELTRCSINHFKKQEES